MADSCRCSVYINRTEWKSVDWINMAQYRKDFCIYGNEKFFHKDGEMFQ
jgi:hypothetical protein